MSPFSFFNTYPDPQSHGLPLAAPSNFNLIYASGGFSHLFGEGFTFLIVVALYFGPWFEFS
jgi:hypothetical protein